MKHQSQTANLAGAKIHYLKAGSGMKTLVLIHGFGDTSASAISGKRSIPLRRSGTFIS